MLIFARVDFARADSLRVDLTRVNLARVDFPLADFARSYVNIIYFPLLLLPNQPLILINILRCEILNKTKLTISEYRNKPKIELNALQNIVVLRQLPKEEESREWRRVTWEAGEFLR